MHAVCTCFLVAILLYNVTWRRINNDGALEFTCEVACRTPSISGCSVVLSNAGGSTSTLVNGTIEAIAPRYVTIVIDNVDPMRSYEYSASALVIVNRTIIISRFIRRIIPALCKNTLIVTALTSMLVSSWVKSYNLCSTVGL